MSAHGGRRQGSGVAVAALGIAAALALIAFASLRGGVACDWDNSYCAESTEKNGLYRGTLLDADGQPYRDGDFSVGFQSREGEPAVDFTTGPDGSFCIQWAQEEITPLVYPRDLELGPAGSDTRGLERWKALESDQTVPGCQKGDGEIPWDRADTLGSSWQFKTLIGVPLVALLALVLSLTPVATRLPRLREVGLAAIVAALVLEFLL